MKYTEKNRSLVTGGTCNRPEEGCHGADHVQVSHSAKKKNKKRMPLYSVT
jgi:hypothetical protein